MNFLDHNKVVTGLSPAALTSTAGDGDYVSMKGFNHLTIVLMTLNAASGNTGGTITVKQATDVANSASDEKAVAFATMYANADAAAGDALTETAVTSNTFTTDATNSKKGVYVIEIDAEDLDVDGGFDCVRVDSTGMVAQLGAVFYLLSEPRYSPAATSAIVD